MAGHARLSQREPPAQLTCGGRATAELFQDRSSAGIAQRLKHDFHA